MWFIFAGLPGVCLNQDLQDFKIYRMWAVVSSRNKLTVISGSPATDLQVWVLWFLFILSLFFISGFAGLLPVVSWVLIDK